MPFSASRPSSREEAALRPGRHGPGHSRGRGPVRDLLERGDDHGRGRRLRSVPDDPGSAPEGLLGFHDRGRGGTYQGQVPIPSDRSGTTTQGATGNPEDVVITGRVPRSASSASGSATVLNMAKNTTIKAVTMADTYGRGSQDLALCAGGDRQVHDSVRVLGHQDTLLSWAGSRNARVRQYIHNSYIEGDVSLTRDSSDNGYIAAASTCSDNPCGILINRSTLGKNASARSVAPGRRRHAGGAADARGQVLVRDSTLGAHVRQASAWQDMSGFSWSTCRFTEYGNSGAGRSCGTSDRPQTSSSNAAKCTPAKCLAGSDNWNPVRQGVPSPTAGRRVRSPRRAFPIGDRCRAPCCLTFVEQFPGPDPDPGGGEQLLGKSRIEQDQTSPGVHDADQADQRVVTGRGGELREELPVPLPDLLQIPRLTDQPRQVSPRELLRGEDLGLLVRPGLPEDECGLAPRCASSATSRGPDGRTRTIAGACATDGGRTGPARRPAPEPGPTVRPSSPGPVRNRRSSGLPGRGSAGRAGAGQPPAAARAGAWRQASSRTPRRASTSMKAEVGAGSRNGRANSPRTVTSSPSAPPLLAAYRRECTDLRAPAPPRTGHWLIVGSAECRPLRPVRGRNRRPSSWDAPSGPARTRSPGPPPCSTSTGTTRR